MAEKEYIEREAALRVLCDACGNAACPKGLIPRCSYYEKMQSIPAADVRPVVLCRDCEYYQADCGWCGWFDIGMNVKDFCSLGKKEGGKLMIPWIYADLDAIIDCYSEPPKEE